MPTSVEVDPVVLIEYGTGLAPEHMTSQVGVGSRPFRCDTRLLRDANEVRRSTNLGRARNDLS